ncbi:hypothetical protein [Shewanella sp. YIC-542]|uniref:hypothetical protein n=1 Tax=Shewanella mytili TaxID=3377111 RepID=UPI00398F28DB
MAQLSVDDFIEDALFYAFGTTRSAVPDKTADNGNIISLHRHGATAGTPLPFSGRHVPLRRATFTLGEISIGQLSILAEDAGVSKSRMLRFLTHYFEQLSTQQRHLLYQQFMVE